MRYDERGFGEIHTMTDGTPGDEGNVHQLEGDFVNVPRGTLTDLHTTCINLQNVAVRYDEDQLVMAHNIINHYKSQIAAIDSVLSNILSIDPT